MRTQVATKRIAISQGYILTVSEGIGLSLTSGWLFDVVKFRNMGNAHQCRPEFP